MLQSFNNYLTNLLPQFFFEPGSSAAIRLLLRRTAYTFSNTMQHKINTLNNLYKIPTTCFQNSPPYKLKYILTRKIKKLQKALRYSDASERHLPGYASCTGNGRFKKNIMTGEKKII